MKKKFIVRTIIFLLIGALFFAGCGNKSSKESSENKKNVPVKEYTCPMHPEIVRKAPGKCPICGMDLVVKQAPGEVMGIDTGIAHLVKPVNEQVVAQTETIVPESGTRIFSIEVQGAITYDTRRQTSIASRVSGRIERLYIKYNYQPVRRGQLIMEIYSPDLASAQRELIYLSKGNNDEALLQKAKQRLNLLGMQQAQIQQVLKTGKIIYRVPVFSSASGYILEKTAVNTVPSVAPPSSNSTGNSGMGSMGSGGGSSMSGGGSVSNSSPINSEISPVLVREGQYVSAGQALFTIYNNSSLVAEFAFNPSLASQINKGQKLVFRKISEPETVFTGSIGLIQPTFRAGENFTIARVYINDSRLQVGHYLTANIPVVNRGWWVPASAVLQLGNTGIVFKKQGNVFVPKVVKHGISYAGLVQIIEGVSGWEIAKNAAYLVDSESFIRVKSNDQKQQQ